MASLDWELSRHDGVTLVRLVVTAETEEWIRIESRLQPVWPPRRQGVPAAGWDDSGFEGRVGPADRLVLGYASPATPVDPPARLRVQGDGPTPDGTAETARQLVRTLGESAPPRDAVPTPAGAASEPPAGQHRSSDEPAQPAVEGVEAVEPWFEAVEGRLAEAERLAGVAGADEARGAIEAVGGIAAVRQLQERLEQDRQKLQQLGQRHGYLADRLAAVDIPLSTLERVT